MIDLHTHSAVSDGSDPPQRVPELAAAAGCRAVALTDHDRLDGIAEARASAAVAGVELVPGCELSCAWTGGTLHLLVYFVEPGEGPLQDYLPRLQRARADRNRRLIARLAGQGLPISEAAVEKEAGGIGAGRPHMAAVLLRAGAVGSIQEAFDTYLRAGTPSSVPTSRPGPALAIGLALDSGGVAVVAHPDSLGRSPADQSAALAELAGLGLAGLEAHYGRYSPERRSELAALAARLGLVATGGSDYHGTYKPDLCIGTGTGDLEVPDHALAALTARRP